MYMQAFAILYIRTRNKPCIDIHWINQTLACVNFYSIEREDLVIVYRKVISSILCNNSAREKIGLRIRLRFRLWHIIYHMVNQIDTFWLQKPINL